MEKIFLMVILISLFVATAGAQELTVQQQEIKPNTIAPSRIAYVEGYRLVDWLKHYKAAGQRDNNTSYYHVGKAWGFIAGVVDGNPEVLEMQEKLTMKQIVVIVDSYLTIHIERWHEPAAVLVINALTPHKGV